MTPGALSTSFNSRDLEEILFDDLGYSCDTRFAVAFSGGIDSTALLVAMASIASRGSADIVAAHVNHGLHSDADHWQAHCRTVAEQLQIEFKTGQVSVINRGAGLEATAREERYCWLAANVEPGTIVLTAHHGFDQAETVLQRAFRGGGTHALGAMRPLTALLGVDVARPLMGFTHDALANYVSAKGFEWIDDPANKDPAFDRSYIRTDVMPLLRKRWPGVDDSLARLAAQSAEDATLLEDLALLDLEQLVQSDAPSVVGGDSALSIAGLITLSSERQRNALRYWIRNTTGAAPSRSRLQSLLDDLCRDCEGAGHIQFGDTAVYKFRGHLYFENSFSSDSSDWVQAQWNFAEPLVMAGTGFKLVAESVKGDGISQSTVDHVNVRGRLADDRLRIHADAPSRSLKNVYQEHAIPPWQRQWIPVLGCPVDDRLIAVPGVGVDASVRASAHETGWVVRVQRL